MAKLKKAKKEAPFDTIIRVDRSVRPTYPEWMKDVLHPELEAVGPTEFEIARVEQWLHDDQKGGNYVRGQVIYDHLKSYNMLESCFGLRDLEEIQKKGIAFFRKYFESRVVFGWRSVVRNRIGDLLAPYLLESDGEVVLGWSWLDNRWYGRDPALRLASST